jgi:hypothetical protein
MSYCLDSIKYNSLFEWVNFFVSSRQVRITRLIILKTGVGCQELEALDLKPHTPDTLKPKIRLAVIAPDY